MNHCSRGVRYKWVSSAKSFVCSRPMILSPTSLVTSLSKRYMFEVSKFWAFHLSSHIQNHKIFIIWKESQYDNMNIFLDPRIDVCYIYIMKRVCDLLSSLLLLNTIKLHAHAHRQSEIVKWNDMRHIKSIQHNFNYLSNYRSGDSAWLL